MSHPCLGGGEKESRVSRKTRIQEAEGAVSHQSHQSECMVVK